MHVWGGFGGDWNGALESLERGGGAGGVRCFPIMDPGKLAALLSAGSGSKLIDSRVVQGLRYLLWVNLAMLSLGSGWVGAMFPIKVQGWLAVLLPAGGWKQVD